MVKIFKSIRIVVVDGNKNEITFDREFLKKVERNQQSLSIDSIKRFLILICLHQELITFNNGEYELRYNRKVNAVK